MRRRLWILLLIGPASAPLAAAALTAQALRRVEQVPPSLCLEQDERALRARGALPAQRRDLIVARSANFALGARIGLWWNIRGAAIEWAYPTFWTEARRAAIFDRLAARMRTCPPRRTAKAPAPRLTGGHC